ncbi:MAG: AAA family ATPase [Thermoproteota archaeon]|nr:AAA family ATPase [Thermoproteota archaeon]
MDERISTGILNLDSLIEGGIPRSSTVMIAGNSGTGKTILSSQFIYNGLTSTSVEPGVYISFSESKAQFYANSKKIGMDFEKFEKQMKFMFLDFISIENDGVQDVFEEILSSIITVNAKRVVLDSFTAMSMSFKDRNEARIAIQVFLGKMMRAEGITNLIIVEVPYGNQNLGNGIEESVADGVIKLEHGIDNASPLFLQVLKMRGSAINREKHVCNITNNGIILYPKQSLKMNFPVTDRRIQSGITSFDERIDGNGLIEGTISAVIGATGCGKSTFAFQFIAEGVRKFNDIGIFCSLEDSEEEIRRLGKGFGYNMSEMETNGRLSIRVYNPDEYNPDAFIADLEVQIKETKTKRLVIDGLSAFERKYKNDLYVITKRISSLTRRYQITTLVTMLGAQTNGFQFTDLNLSPLFQNIVLLRFVELYGRMKRVLLILKINVSHQDESILEFKISKDKGIEIMGPIGNDYTGIFTGISRK